MSPKKGLGLMVMIGVGKPKGKMGKPAAKKPGGIKTMPKGKRGSGSQGRGY